MNRRHVLSLLGPNGCGKGTTCNFLQGLGAHISVASDVLEKYALRNKSIGETIHQYKTVRKENVPDSIVVDAMVAHIHPIFRQMHKGLFILDGYGRGTGQITGFAEWIDNRNADYRLKDRPEIEQGYVFLTLSFEEAMKRVQKRIAEFEAKGLPPRAEDIDGVPERRYETYAKSEEILKRVAHSATGSVLTVDLAKHDTLTAASYIWGMTQGIEPEEIARSLRENLRVVA